MLNQNKIQLSLWTTSFVVVGVIGLLVYGQNVLVPGYSGLIEESRELGKTLPPAAPPTLPFPMVMSLTPPMTEAGEHHKPLRVMVDIPGATRPNLLDANSTIVNDTDNVFGVVVNGKAYAFAFAASAFSNSTGRILNLLIDQTPISVTYCELMGCFRVLTSDAGTNPIDLRIGGFDVACQMVFLLDGIRYDQTSTEIPLQDLPFEKTTLGDWKAQHPDTLVYEG